MRFPVHVSPLAAAVLSFALFGSGCGAAPASLGTFKVNGVDTPLGYAGLVAMPPTNGTPRMVLVLAEKAPAPGADANMLSYTGGLGASVSGPIVQDPEKGWSAPAGFSYFHPSAKDHHGWCASTNCVLKDAVVKDGEFHAHLVSTAAPAATGESVVLDMNLRIRMP